MALSSIHVVAHGTSDGLYGRVGGCHLTTLTAGCGSYPMCVCCGQPSTCAEGGPQVLGCVTSATSPAREGQVKKRAVVVVVGLLQVGGFFWGTELGNKLWASLSCSCICRAAPPGLFWNQVPAVTVPPAGWQLPLSQSPLPQQATTIAKFSQRR